MAFTPFNDMTNTLHPTVSLCWSSHRGALSKTKPIATVRLQRCGWSESRREKHTWFQRLSTERSKNLINFLTTR